jgi:hypothetical protein
MGTRSRSSGAWRKAAKNQGWTLAEITLVIEEATKGDYNHLLAVIMTHTES